MVVKMDIKKRMKGEHGLTLIEILIGIVITALMMGAMYTSYNVVNKTYNQVSDKAKISKTSRDLISMLMRDVRMAGYKYYAGSYTIEKFAEAGEGAGAALWLAGNRRRRPWVGPQNVSKTS